MSTTAFAVDFPTHRSRLTTLFRLILAIPLIVVSYLYQIVALFATMIAWVALVITGRYPTGLFNFVAGFVRFQMRFASYLYLLVDAYPPFSGGEHPDYPAHVTIPDRKPKYSRLKAFFRIIYIIPAYLVVAVLMIVFLLLDVLAWFTILIAGRLPSFITDYMRFAFGWVLKFYGLYYLLTENY